MTEIAGTRLGGEPIEEKERVEPMAKNTKISWATDTFSTHWGCSEVPGSEACEKCYAREFSKRLGFDLWGNDKARRFFGDAHWNEPKKWNREAERTGLRRRIFVNSMSDTFEGRRDLDPVRARLWESIPETPYCDYLLLTKRPQNILRMVPHAWLDRWPANVWAGTTTETQRWADIRLPFMEKVPAPVIFVSAEPLLERLDFSPYLRFVNWVLIGGESGHGARRMDPAWAIDLIVQCREACVAVHFKQKGEALARELGCKDRAGKDSSEWPPEFRVQEFPAA
jgi:protein gp37